MKDLEKFQVQVMKAIPVECLGKSQCPIQKLFEGKELKDLTLTGALEDVNSDPRLSMSRKYEKYNDSSSSIYADVLRVECLPCSSKTNSGYATLQVLFERPAGSDGLDGQILAPTPPAEIISS